MRPAGPAADLDDTDRLQRLLYGLHALIEVHIWKEERLYLTLLESPAWPTRVAIPVSMELPH
jgi:hypothetical protein